MPADTEPFLAILFWYYKEPVVCAARLRQLRKLNPHAPIYGLFGGSASDFPRFKRLDRWLNDNWCFPDNFSATWKWRNGDLMITEWFSRRGESLLWDSIVVMQWDMMIFAGLNALFPSVRFDDVYLPGARPLSGIDKNWYWTKPDTAEGAVYSAFVRYLDSEAIHAELWACQFVTAILPRVFLKKYASLPKCEPGFLEYTLPTYARHFGFNLLHFPHISKIWKDERALGHVTTLDAEGGAISPRVMVKELLKARGARMFHPVFREFRFGGLSIAWAAMGEQIWLWRRRMRGHPAGQQ